MTCCGSDLTDVSCGTYNSSNVCTHNSQVSCNGMAGPRSDYHKSCALFSSDRIKQEPRGMIQHWFELATGCERNGALGGGGVPNRAITIPTNCTIFIADWSVGSDFVFGELIGSEWFCYSFWTIITAWRVFSVSEWLLIMASSFYYNCTWQSAA